MSSIQWNRTRLLLLPFFIGAASVASFAMMRPPFHSGIIQSTYCSSTSILPTFMSRTKIFSEINGATDSDDFEFEPDDAALEELEQVDVMEFNDDDEEEVIEEEEELTMMEDQTETAEDEQDDPISIDELGEEEIVAEFEQVLDEEDIVDDLDLLEDEELIDEEIVDEEDEDLDAIIFDGMDYDQHDRDARKKKFWKQEDVVKYDLQDDDDPNYMIQKELVMANEKRLKNKTKQEEYTFDPMYYLDNITDTEGEIYGKNPVLKLMEEQMKNMTFDPSDFEDEDIESITARLKEAGRFLDDEPFELDDEDYEKLEKNEGFAKDEVQALQESWANLQELQNFQTRNFATDADERILTEEEKDEMILVLSEIYQSGYNCTPYLIYDLDYNVTNLVLASIQINPESPIIYAHWYPQLVVMKRYEEIREKGFDWDWDAVEGADQEELTRYYAGLGYSEIPTKMPSETNIISLEDLDYDEIKMASMEHWLTEVYNGEWDKKDFDDDDIKDEDNVFSKNFEMPPHPEQPLFDDAQDDVRRWNMELDLELDGDEITEEEREYRDYHGEEIKYEIVHDPEFEELFRGHVVVACTADDSDLEIAEKITLAMEKNFGKQVFVETRVMTHATDEDNVFEVWIESYDVELLHSKRRASMGTYGWTGPAECDDAQVEYLVSQVGFLISDDYRYSYKFEFDYTGC